MPDGNHWQKVIAKEAIRALGGEDYCGVLPGTDQWMWSAGGSGIIRVKGNKEMMLGRVDRMTPMDMPDFDSGLERARKGFLRVKDAAAKHIIIISDGDPVPPSTPVINGLKALKVTASSVAVGAHGPAESAVMKDLATRLGGKYYQVQNPNALPRIFQKEARRVARPLVYERDAGFRPYVKFPHEMVSGIESPLPPLFGFVQTSVKKNPLVEVSLVSPEPAGSEDNTTILASWTYGLGKAVAFTSDTGGRWAKAWTGQTFYDKLFAQMVRWSMRPVGDQAKFTVATDLEQGVVSVFVTALDKNDEFLNFLDLSGAVIDPEGKSQQVKLAQTAPGRYVGSFPAQATGSYHVMLSPGAGRTPLLVGVNVPYSQEFRDRGSDEALMASLAELTPTGGKPGMVIKDADGVGNVDELLKVNTFRHDLPKATSRQEVWHLVLLAAACVFFGDVFVRRVALDLAPVAKFAGRLRDKLTGRATPPPPPEFIARLRSRKAEVSEKLEQQRASARFEPSPDAPVDTAVLEEQLASGPRETKPPPGRTGLAPEKAEEDSYTSRLLKVKKDVQKKMGQEE
jgi:hypothetical protein